MYSHATYFRNARSLQITLIVIFLVINLANFCYLDEYSVTAPDKESMFLSSPVPSAAIRALEALLIDIDSHGSVKTSIVTIQNNSHYQRSDISPFVDLTYEHVVNRIGYVAESMLAVLSETPYPNGAIGGPSIVLQTEVRPFVVLPSEANPLHVTPLNTEQALEISADFVQAYEDMLGVKFESLMRYEMSHTESVRYNDNSENVSIVTYNLVYVCLSPDSQLFYRRQFDHIGGFMRLANGSGITSGRWVFVERLRVIDERKYLSARGGSSPYLFGGIAIGTNQTVQIDPSPAIDIDIGLTVIDMFTSISHIPQSTTGQLSLAELLGFSGPIENLMQHDPSARAVSFISCAAPSIISISGIPPDWVSLNSSAAPFEVFRPPCGYGKSSITVPLNTSVYNMTLGLAWQLPMIVARESRPMTFAVDSSLIHPYHDGFWKMPEDVSHWSEWDEVSYPLHMEQVSFVPIRWGAYLFSWVRSPVINLTVSEDVMGKCLDIAGITSQLMASNLNISAPVVTAIPMLLQSLFDLYHHDDSRVCMDDDKIGDVCDYLESEAHMAVLFEHLNTFLNNNDGVTLPTAFTTQNEAKDFFDRHRESLIIGWCTAINKFLYSPLDKKEERDLAAFLSGMISWQDIVRYMVPVALSDVRPMNGAPDMDRIIAVNFDRSELNSIYDRASPKLYICNDIIINGSFNGTAGTSEGPRLIIERFEGSENDLRSMNSYSWNDISSWYLQFNAPIFGSCVIENVGTEPAYNLTLYNPRPYCDIVNIEYDAPLDILSPGDNITITYQLIPQKVGNYRDLPAICVYYSRPLNTLNESSPETWDGLHLYVTTPIDYIFSIHAEPGILDWLTGSTAGIPNYIFVGGGAVLGIVALVVLMRRRA